MSADASVARRRAARAHSPTHTSSEFMAALAERFDDSPVIGYSHAGHSDLLLQRGRVHNSARYMCS